ncbi:MAG: PilT/PilU family type 4a pilus ATPase [Kiritimatiellae bacterium]|nr:PilT/PilU family type 4a pilus ATPase [Kiritimatiellia bacterium]
MNKIFLKLFECCEANLASDIHITSGEAPYLRIHGKLSVMQSFDVISTEQSFDLALSLMLGMNGEDSEDASVKALASARAIDGAVSSPAGSRYRFNIFKQNNGYGIALRRLDDEFLSLGQLGLPEQLEAFCKMSHGLVIVSGPTGSGKSTTIATLLDMINSARPGHIITIEDPIEYIHKSKQCLVQQRQIGRDAVDFNSALVEALRQDPDTIFVGEMREIETMRTAITAAETGHLVFTTLHSGDTVGAIERFVAVFPEGEQESIRQQLSLVLRGVFAQRLLPGKEEGCRRVVSNELLLVTPAVANLIATGKSRQITSMMQTGRASGMITFEESVNQLYNSGRISSETYKEQQSIQQR